MKTAMITFVCMVCGFGFMQALFQVIDIIQARAWPSLVGQLLIMAGAVVFAAIAIKYIKKMRL